MLQRTILYHGLVSVQVMGSQFLVPAVGELSASLDGDAFSIVRRRTTGREECTCGTVDDVVFFRVRVANAKVHDGPVGAGFVVLGRPVVLPSISDADVWVWRLFAFSRSVRLTSSTPWSHQPCCRRQD